MTLRKCTLCITLRKIRSDYHTYTSNCDCIFLCVAKAGFFFFVMFFIYLHKRKSIKNVFCLYKKLVIIIHTLCMIHAYKKQKQNKQKKSYDHFDKYFHLFIISSGLFPTVLPACLPDQTIKNKQTRGRMIIILLLLR